MTIKYYCSFAYIGKMSSLDQEMIIPDWESSETTDSIFSTFVNQICEELKKENNFRKVRRNCMQNVNVTAAISLSKNILDEIYNASDFDELFDVLCRTQYWNWMNIKILEKMAGDCVAAKVLINQYKSKVFSRKVKDVISEIPTMQIPADKYTEVKEKFDKDFDDLTIKDVVKQWSEIEKRLNVKEAMLLKSITGGCVEICWLLPNLLVEHAINSATNEQPVKHNNSSENSTQDEVLYLKIGDTVIKDIIISKFKCNTK